MVDIMSIDQTEEIQRKTTEKRRSFADMCRRVFRNGENMSNELADYGVEYSPSACRDFLNNKSHPSIVKAFAIQAVIDLKDEQELARIKARRDRVRLM